MSKLTSQQRKNLSASQFAVPIAAPGSGSFPINDESHAQNALARSAGKPVASKVKAAVKKKYPQMGVKGAIQKAMRNG